MVIQEYREKKGITQTALAALITKDMSLISKFEKGIALTSVPTAKAIGKTLGFKWIKIFDDKEE